jgi:ribosomal protein L37AE/L43A
MAGPIGMAVLAGMQKLVCPHCGTAQARDRALRGKVKCKKCKKLFAVADGRAKPKKRR